MPLGLHEPQQNVPIPRSRNQLRFLRADRQRSDDVAMTGGGAEDLRLSSGAQQMTAQRTVEVIATEEKPSVLGDESGGGGGEERGQRQREQRKRGLTQRERDGLKTAQQGVVGHPVRAGDLRGGTRRHQRMNGWGANGEGGVESGRRRRRRRKRKRKRRRRDGRKRSGGGVGGVGGEIA